MRELAKERVLYLYQNVSFMPGCSAKSFVRNVATALIHGADNELSERQIHYIEILSWRFRRQMPPRLVPAHRPPDLPPKPPRERKLRGRAPGFATIDESENLPMFGDAP